MLIDLLVLFTILYTLQICVFAIAAHRARYSNDPARRPTVSIIIAARNEERNIRPCLESIAALTYPKDLLEVVIVNDHSTDGTGRLIQEYAERFAFIKLHNATEDPSIHFKGKTNAVTQGIERTNGDLILFTDADCVVPPQWVEETAKYYDDDAIGVVAGFTSLRSNSLFEAIQALDWFMLFSIAAATIRLHFPVTAVGNNLSVRRKAYDAAGGYRKIPFSITEDYALFHAVTSGGTYRARFPVDPGTLVRSLPCESWQDLYKQKKRWFIGGADMDMKSISLFIVGYAFKLMLLVNVIVHGPGPVWIPLLLKCGADYMLLRPALSMSGRINLLGYFIPFEIYYILYVVLFPPVVLFSRKVAWKERKFT